MRQTKKEIIDDKIKQDIKEDEIENEKKEKLVDFLKYYVKPHEKVSRYVKESDLETVIKDSHIMYNLCFSQREKYSGALAIAHQQINDKDPLRFFITKNRKIIINPIITRHTNSYVDSFEGCLSFPKLPEKIIQRWNKIEVDYLTITGDGKKLIKKSKSLRGKESKIYQHEIDHFSCSYIY